MFAVKTNGWKEALVMSEDHVNEFTGYNWCGFLPHMNSIVAQWSWTRLLIFFIVHQNEFQNVVQSMVSKRTDCKPDVSFEMCDHMTSVLLDI